MGTNGIVRRIDELGRIVIPKEIRKSLNIKDGEMLEIIPDVENRIVIKKYSMVKDIKNISCDIVKNISKLTSHICVITDLSNVIDVGNNDNSIDGNFEITKELYNIIYSREIFNSKSLDNMKLFVGDDNKYYFKVIVPIILDSYVVGSIILLSKDLNSNISDSDINLIKFASLIISSTL